MFHPTSGLAGAGRHRERVRKEPGKQQLRKCVRQWAANGPVVDELRLPEIREAATAASIWTFEMVSGKAVRILPPQNSFDLFDSRDFMHHRLGRPGQASRARANARSQY